MKIRAEKVNELKDGRKNNTIAEILGISFQHVSNLFKGRYDCPKIIALSLISLKEKIAIDDRAMAEWLKYYFEEE